MVPFNTAISAYNSVAKPLPGLDTAGTDSQAAGLPSFEDFFKSSVENVIDVSHKAESVSAMSLVGKASASDVVTAMTNMEMTMRETTKIRDEMVSAYEDIMKMPI